MRATSRFRTTFRLRVVLIATLVGLAAASCGDDSGGDDAEGDASVTTVDAATASTTTETPKVGGVLTMGTYSEPSGLDPVVPQGGGTSGNSEMSAIYGTLMRYDETSRTYEPSMAESLTANADSTEWTLKLRPGVTFTDGSPYDADAVVFGMKRHTQYGSTVAGLLSTISEYTAVDATTVTFKLKTAWPGFPYVLSHSPGMIPSKAAIQAACPDPATPARDCSFNRAPVGAGPFMLDTFTPKESIVLERNPDYWAGDVPLDGVKFVTLRGGELTYESIKSGELQVGFLREAAAIARANEEGTVDVFTNRMGLGGIALLNNGKITCKNGLPAAVCAGKPDGIIDLDKPTADVRIRQAIAAAMDPEQMNARMNNGTGHPGSEFFQDGPFAGEPTAKYDPNKAKELVAEVKAETGWDGSISVTCLQEQATGPTFVASMEAMLNAVGFKVVTDLKPSTEYISRVQLTRDYDIACWGFNVAPEAPEAGLSRHVLSVAGGNPSGNAMNLNNAEIDALILQIRAASTDVEKKAALDELAKVWNEEQPSVVYANNDEVIASDKSVRGLRYNVATTVLFDEAWLDS
jgi:peptide/nickel transport system substrate-binding protein